MEEDFRRIREKVERLREELEAKDFGDREVTEACELGDILEVVEDVTVGVSDAVGTVVTTVLPRVLRAVGSGLSGVEFRVEDEIEDGLDSVRDAIEGTKDAMEDIREAIEDTVEAVGEFVDCITDIFDD